jgi:hypothetical protein
VAKPDEFLGILRFAVHENLVIHVGAGAATGAPKKADLRMRGNRLAYRNDTAVHMTV